MNDRIEKITIVGGGTSGWLAALFFGKRFKRELLSGSISIELIESDSVAPIGVGESLSPSFPETLKSLGVDERAIFREADATFKLAGLFVDWEAEPENGGSSWINPFVGYLSAGLEFERFEVPLGADYASVVTPCREAINKSLAPRRLNDPEYSSVLRYAYHVDAAKLARLLRRYATETGVKRLVDEVIDADLDERGFIRNLVLRTRGSHAVQLVIDASGFHSAVLHRVLNVPLRDYSRYLLNDRAVVAQIDTDSDSAIEPATRSTALGQGWAFTVPLPSRTGNGFIFSSSITSDTEAADIFTRHLGPQADPDQFRVIPMRVGRAERTWVKNCVALGLSAGFVEPLEASAIYSVETSLKWLWNYFPDLRFEEKLALRYNERVKSLFEEIVDYVSLHYRLSQRSDHRYWLIQRNEMALSNRLRDNLEIWRRTLPTDADVAPCNYFDKNTYISALFGKRFYPGNSLKPERSLDVEEWQSLKATIEEAHARALSKLPAHRELIAALRS